MHVGVARQACRQAGRRAQHNTTQQQHTHTHTERPQATPRDHRPHLARKYRPLFFVTPRGCLKKTLKNETETSSNTPGVFPRQVRVLFKKPTTTDRWEVHGLWSVCVVVLPACLPACLHACLPAFCFLPCFGFLRCVLLL